MSELDDFFGPRHATVAVNRSPTNWGNAPEHLRPLLDKWEAVHAPSHKSKRKSLIASAHRYYEEVGGDVRLMELTYEYMRSKGLFRKNLGSLITIALEFKENPQPGSAEYEEEFFDGWNFD
jgi:hypothetical protein